MIGVLVNTLTVLLGSGVGLLLKKGIPERVANTLMKGVGLCTVCIGFAGVIKGENTLVMILSVAVGGLLGCLLHIDDGLNRFSVFLEKKAQKLSKEGELSLARGFISGKKKRRRNSAKKANFHWRAALSAAVFYFAWVQ